VPKTRSRSQTAAARAAKLLRRVTRGALLAVSLKAAQLAAEEATKFRMFDRQLVDRLKPPLTRYHE